MKNLTTKLSFASALTLALTTFGAPSVYAQATPAATPDNTISFNAALTSDYRYRGVSQSRQKPALQGGADYTHNPSGLYAGVWASTIKWTKDTGGDGDVELDLYGGKRGEIIPGFTYDVGGLYYYYPENDLKKVAGLANANTFEVYGQVGFGPAYVKYSRSTTNLFGNRNSEGSGYLDIGANVDLGTGLVLNLHAGRQTVKHNGFYNYNDYKIGVTKDLGFASVSLAVISADTNSGAYVTPAKKDTGRTGAVLAISKTF